MRAVDTNVLVRLVTRDDPREAATADAFVEEGAWVSVLALAEAVWVLSATYDRKPLQIAATLEMLLQHKSLTLQSPKAVTAAVGQLRATPSAGFSDCFLIELAREAGHLPLGTFDRGLAKIEGTQRL